MPPIQTLIASLLLVSFSWAAQAQQLYVKNVWQPNGSFRSICARWATGQCHPFRSNHCTGTGGC
ncbi:hypothetical protein, partial [Siphonobacter sp. BAB-5405]|uniref:hypothetical protein n=1 Tax=Siphonobacter sp. BAB-5405 TaxID=1864825 RepID=UPI001E5B2B56